MLQKEGIDEDHLFFTSVTEAGHPLNEFTRLRAVLEFVMTVNLVHDEKNIGYLIFY